MSERAPAVPRPSNRPLYFALAALVLSVLLNGFYTTWEVAQSQHRWCATLVTLDEADHHAPKPTSAFGRNLVRDFHVLRGGFGCGS